MRQNGQHTVLDAAARRRDAIRAIVDTAPPSSTEQFDVIAGILRHPAAIR
jgi:hypothetical protein